MARTKRVTQIPSYTSKAKFRDPPSPYYVPERVATYSQPEFTSSSVTLDDVHRSPVTEGFRPPQSYFAYGSNSSSAGVNFSGLFYDGPYRIDFSTNGLAGGDTVVAFAPSVRPLISRSDIDRAVIGMLKVIGDQKWSAGQAILEMQGAFDTIGNAANSIQKAIFASVRKDWRGVAKALGVPPKKVKSGSSAADGWLQYQFAIVPLVDDIANAALLLSGHGGRRDAPIIVAKCRLSESNTIVDTVGNRFQLHVPSGALIDVHYRDKTVFTDDWKASIYYEMDVSWLNGLSRYGLLGLSTPWAVLPQSYLVDWLLPIGDYLAAWDATLGLTYKGGSFTRFQKAQVTRKMDNVKIHAYRNPRDTVVGTAYWSTADTFEMRRGVWTSSPLPFPAYIKNPFSTFKAITSIALLRQLN